MTKAIIIIALACFLIVGVVATGILGRDSLPVVQSEMASSVARSPISNREAKKDKLSVAAAAAAFPPFDPPQTAAIPNESMRQAFAATPPAIIDVPKGGSAPAMLTAPQKSKLAARPAPQKNYALLSDVQIAGIKERLRLSSDQESYWPAVENALRAVARKIHATRQSDPGAIGAPIDPDADEVKQLKSAAMPLLFQLREDQKREVRSLARIIGLEKVASMI